MTPTPDKRPDVEGIAAFIRGTLHHASSFASQYEGDGSVFHIKSIEAYDKLPALIAYIKALEAVVEAGQLVAEGSGVEVGTTPLRMRLLRERLAALADGDG